MFRGQARSTATLTRTPLQSPRFLVLMEEVDERRPTGTPRPLNGFVNRWNRGVQVSTEKVSVWRRLGAWFGLVSDLVQLTSALLGVLVLVGGGSAVIGYLQHNGLMVAIGAVVITLGVALIVILQSLLARPKRGLVRGRLAKALSRQDLKLRLKEITYTYDAPKTKLSQRKRFEVEALRDGLASFTDRYFWTGDGPCTIHTDTAGFHIVNQRKREFWDVYDVEFPHPVSRGTVVEFVVCWDLVDDSIQAQPFLSTMIDVETDRLEMRVRLPRAIRPSVAYAHVFQNYIHDIPVETSAAEWDDTTELLSVSVDNPALNSKYVVNWQW